MALISRRPWAGTTRCWRLSAAILLCATQPALSQVARFEGCVAFETQIRNSVAAAEIACRDSFEVDLPPTTLIPSPGGVVNASRDHVVTRFSVLRRGGACDGAVAHQLRPLWPGHQRRGAAAALAWIPPRTGDALVWRPATCPAGAGERPGRDYRLTPIEVRGLKVDR